MLFNVTLTGKKRIAAKKGPKCHKIGVFFKTHHAFYLRKMVPPRARANQLNTRYEYMVKYLMLYVCKWIVGDESSSGKGGTNWLLLVTWHFNRSPGISTGCSEKSLPRIVSIHVETIKTAWPYCSILHIARITFYRAPT